MRIRSVTIHNWRSIKDESIDFSDLIILIGQNNHGKSNVLTALLFFFGQISICDLDYNDGAQELFVEVTFQDLDDHDKAQFKKYLTTSNTIKIRKDAEREVGVSYHGYTEIPEDDWLKEEKIVDYSKRDSVELTPLKEFIPSSGRLLRENIKQAQESYIEKYREKLKFNYALESTNFLGLKTVAQGIFGNVFYIPAVKNASDEFNIKGSTIFNQLLSGVISEMSTSNTNYQDARKKIIELTQILNRNSTDGSINKKRPEELVKLEAKLKEELKNWDDTSIEIEITPPNIDEIFKLGTSVWVNDGIKTDIAHKGHGLQRSLIFALIKSWSSILKSKKDKGELEEKQTRKTSQSVYFLFEEPELYLHPQAQRQLYESLKDLSKLNNQIILTTHSSYFIDLTEYKSICILYKNNLKEGTKCRQFVGELFDSKTADDNKNFNMVYWINPDRGELFFAKKVVLLEGPTDKTVIPYLAKKVGKYRYDYTLIDCGGKPSIPTYIKLLNKFKIPYIAVYDLDHQEGKREDAIGSADRDSKKIEEQIDSGLGTSVILKNDIEEEINLIDKTSKNKPFVALKHISNDTFSLTKDLSEKIVKIFS